MQAKLLVFAATLAALFGWTSTASAQYGPGAGPYGGGGGYPSAPYGVAQFPGALGMAAYQPAPPPEAPGAPGGIGCTDSACGCGDGSCCDDCCSGWCHRINVFGELLYLRPRNAEIAYAVPINGNLAPGGQVQIGPVALIDPDFEAAFRGGVGFTLNECSAIVASYTNFESRTLNDVQLAGGGPDNPALWPLILSPFVFNPNILTLDAAALMDLNFELIDVDYKGLIAYNCDYRVNYVVGARYATLDQLVAATYTAGVTTNNVVSAVNFDGAGLKLGLEGEYYACNSQFYGYGKGYGELDRRRVPHQLLLEQRRRSVDHRHLVDRWPPGRHLRSGSRRGLAELLRQHPAERRLFVQHLDERREEQRVDQLGPAEQLCRSVRQLQRPLDL